MNRSDPKQVARALLVDAFLFAVTAAGARPVSAQTITEFPLPAATSGPGTIVNGPDGALWYTADKRIGRITPAGVVTEFPFPPNVAGPTDITLGPDGALWFSVCGVYLHQPIDGGSRIGRLTPDGALTTFPLPSPASCPLGIATGPDGNIWFTQRDVSKIGRITPAGTITEFPQPQAGAAGPIAAGADGHLWYSSVVTGRSVVGRVSTTGEIVEFLVQGPEPRCPNGLTAGPDGHVWFVEGCSTFGAAVSRITPSGTLTTFALPSPSCSPERITTGPDGALWFTERGGNRVGRMTPDGALTEFPLPSARSYPGGIAVGPDRAIWFTESGRDANRIGRITAPGIVYSSVRLDPAEASLAVGQAVGIVATLGAATATDSLVTLRVSHPGIVIAPASVLIPAGETSRSFEVVGQDPGTVLLTAQLPDGESSAAVSVTVTEAAPGTSQARLVPIVLDVTTPIAHYTSELTLTNTTSSALTTLLTYAASLGDGAGSGSVALTLAPGEQRIVPDAISFLRGRGLTIPGSATGPQGGTLRAVFHADRELLPAEVGILARTTTATTAPQPVGSAGLAYLGLSPQDAITGSATLFGLRADSADRSNVALFNSGSVPVRVRVTVVSGSGDVPDVTFREAEELPPYGWLQYGSAEILGSSGLSNAWVNLKQVSAEGSFGAYAVINDNRTSDGSFLLPEPEDAVGTRLLVPVLVETPSFRSELVLSNRGTSSATLVMRYVESLTPSLGAGGSATIELPAGRQLIIPDAVDFLRSRSVGVGPKDAASYAGSLGLSVSGVASHEVFAAARTASLSPAGGQFGLFTPAIREGAAATSRALLLGLRDDETTRSNVAAVNAGPEAAGSVTISLQAYDAEAGGIPRGDPEALTLAPGEWRQLGRFLRSRGVRNGWVTIDRAAGTAPWLAYGVINDGAFPGERTGDGAYLPMVVTGDAASSGPAMTDETLELPGTARDLGGNLK